MAETSAISWTDGTVNFWWGCTKVGPGCDHCYAETLNNFRGNKMWGPGAPRRKIKGAVSLIRKLQRDAGKFYEANGRRRRIFMHSMSDVFDNEVEEAWRMEALGEAEKADQLDIQLLTKRVGNVAKMVPMSWITGHWPQHIGLMVTVVTQAEADRDVPKLLELKALHRIPWIGVSVEPMQEDVSLKRYMWPVHPSWPAKYRSPEEALADGAEVTYKPQGLLGAWVPVLDWVIIGGESGPGARPFVIGWARRLITECVQSKTAVLMKQIGSNTTNREGEPHPHTGKGHDMSEWPEDIRIQQFPRKLDVAAEGHR